MSLALIPRIEAGAVALEQRVASADLTKPSEWAALLRDLGIAQKLAVVAGLDRATARISVAKDRLLEKLASVLREGAGRPTAGNSVYETEIPKQVRQAVHTHRSDWKDVTPARREVVRLEAVEQGEPVTRQVKRAESRKVRNAEMVTRVEAIAAQPAPPPEGPFDVVVVDPPWPQQRIERECRPNQTRVRNYPVMSLEEIGALALPATDAHVWLWTTQRFLPAAFGILQEWEARYVCTFVWHKAGGVQPWNLPMYNAEFALYARLGKPAPFVDLKAFRTCFSAPRLGDSIKPGEFYEMVARVTVGRRIDMFSRRSIPGFEAWGNEAQSMPASGTDGSRYRCDGNALPPATMG